MNIPTTKAKKPCLHASSGGVFVVWFAVVLDGPYVSQTGPESTVYLMIFSGTYSSCLHLQGSEITGTHHHTLLIVPLDIDSFDC